MKGNIVGPVPARDKEYKKMLLMSINEKGLKNIITMSAPVPNSEVPKILRSSFAHVNSSLPHLSLDKTVLEAMASGIPSLTSIVGLEKTMGKYSKTLIFKHGNPLDLANKLENLINLNSLELSEMGIYLRERINKLHNLEQLSSRLVKIFSAVSR